MNDEQVLELIDKFKRLSTEYKFYTIEVFDVPQQTYISGVELNETSGKTGYVLQGNSIRIDGMVRIFQYILGYSGMYVRNYSEKQL